MERELFEEFRGQLKLDSGGGESYIWVRGDRLDVMMMMMNIKW